MSVSLFSFLLWCLMMLVIIGVMLYLVRKSRNIDNEVEDVASEALPQIGSVAESCHEKCFGDSEELASHPPWYPKPKKKSLHHA